MIRTQEIFVIQLDRYHIHPELFTKKDEAEKVAKVMADEFGDEKRLSLQGIVDSETASEEEKNFATYMLNDDHGFSHVYKIGVCSYRYEVLTLKEWLDWLDAIMRK